ncbi:thiamine pyrophosphate-dependent dehydrogenase E1 component subunit alpha [Paenibacillus thermotolerans]|uniref:thiamine pyrophosphate-dependent dehydrogenase E1 component subunit alpha n=1 Tax=Paenibacillus thermotolerans TaxID=3027807 RepID=UPI00236816D4|nr:MULTISPECIES: thiamine pyrophosphate-dependent dehydrogenase E1 component subunit alpha [unclassified Paenibacillus]
MDEKKLHTEQAKHIQLGLNDFDVIAMYKKMKLARKFDERALVLQRAGKTGFHVSGIGQETAQVAAAYALSPGTDMLFPYYRDYAFVLSVGMTVRDLMLSLLSKAEDPTSGGRQMPGHFGSKRLNIFTGSSPVTTQVPHAVGAALAARMRGEESVAFATFGEGSSNQGDFHEGCNFAGVFKLPVILMCENNRYAISIPEHKQVAGRIVDRAIGYGFPGVRVDGNDALEVYAAVKEARQRALAGEGPTLIEAMMYRISPHSTADNDLLYRTKEEVEENRAKDGIPRFKNYLIEHGLWDEGKEAALDAELAREIQEATEYADRAPYPEPETTMLYVYGDERMGG